MSRLEQAGKVITAAIKTKRAGTPCSVRIIDHTVADHGLILSSLAAGMRAAGEWLGAEPDTLYAMGGVEAGQITTLMRFANGQTAWVSAGTTQGEPLFDATVVGSKGVLSWEPIDEPYELIPTPTQPSEQEQKLIDLVRKSLDESTKSRQKETAQSKPAPAALRPALKPPYGVLIVTGSGTHQEGQARAFAADPRCKLVGVADESDVSPRRKTLNEKLAKELNIPVLPDLDKALAREDVHVASICTEPDRRGRVIQKCAQAGKHLLLDKPLTDSLAEADRVVETIERAGVISQMFSHAHTSLAQRARAWLDSRRLGRMLAVHCDLFFAKGPAGTAVLKRRVESAVPRQIETLEAKRELTNVGVYALVFIGWLLNRKPLRVSAATANYFFEEHQRDDLEDFGLIALELEGGVTATLSAGRTGWSSHPLSGVNKVTLVGTQAAVSIDGHRPRLEIWADEPPWLPPERHPEDPMGFWRSTPVTPKKAWMVPVVPQEAYVTEIAYFLDCLEQGRESDVDAKAGAAALEILMAAYQSAASGKTIDLPLPRS